ncbi:Ada metal-binding domain-containing protein [Chryseosolibacter indicus]
MPLELFFMMPNNMYLHQHLTEKEVWRLIRSGKIAIAGNIKLKIYGKLNCSSGKRMKKQNRIFFTSVEEALQQGFRACKRCSP